MATFLDSVRGASVTVPGGTLVELRSDGGGTAAVITLVYSAVTSGTAVTTIATIDTGTASTQFGLRGHDLDLALVADPLGNLYVIGRYGSGHSRINVQRYARTGSTNVWTAAGFNSQSLSSEGEYITQVCGAYSPGTGSSPVETILLMVRREGDTYYNNISYATIKLSAVTASTGSMFIEYDTDPFFTPDPPRYDADDTGQLDVGQLTEGSTTVVIASDGYSVVRNINGKVYQLAHDYDGAHYAQSRVRVIGIDSNTWAEIECRFSSPFDLRIKFRGTNGSTLGTVTLAAATAWGGAFGTQWDAFYNRVSGVISVYHVANESARQIDRIDVSPATYLAAATVVTTTTMGAASSANLKIRVPRGAPVDERRILLEASNLLTATQSLAVLADTAGNVAPSAPILFPRTNFDATSAVPFAWTFGDANPADTQTARTFEIQRVSDSVNVYAPGKVASTVQGLTLAGSTLTNGVDYRWRVRTYDVLDATGTYSGYGTFSTSSVGTLTITDPATDNALLEDSEKAVVWTYSQANGYTQAQRRVRMTRTSDSVVVLDTTMQVSTALTYTVTGLENAVEYRFDLDIINTNSQTTSATRLITASFANPMPPVLTLATGLNYIHIAVTNPTPTGVRPETVKNSLYRRLDATDDPFVLIGATGYNGTYLDRQVASATAYEYHAIASDSF